MLLHLEKRRADPDRGPAGRSTHGQGLSAAGFHPHHAFVYLTEVAPISEAEHVIEAVLPGAEERRLLKIPAKEPCIRLHRLPGGRQAGELRRSYLSRQPLSAERAVPGKRLPIDSGAFALTSRERAVLESAPHLLTELERASRDGFLNRSIELRDDWSGICFEEGRHEIITLRAAVLGWLWPSVLRPVSPATRPTLRRGLTEPPGFGGAYFATAFPYDPSDDEGTIDAWSKRSANAPIA
jgi:hypothetical protein